MNVHHPLKPTLVFTLLGFIQPSLNVLLLPIYLEYIEPDDYAILALMGVFSAFLVVLVGLKIESAFRVKYFDYNQDEKLLQQYLKNIFSITLLLALLWLVILIFVGPFLFNLLFASQNVPFYPYGITAAVSTLSSLCLTPYFIYLKNKLDLKRLVAWTLVIIILSVILKIYFVVQVKLGVIGILAGGAIPNMLILLVVLFTQTLFTLKDLRHHMIKSTLSFSISIIPFVLLELLIVQGDRYFVSLFLNMTQVGQYALIMTIAHLVTIIFNSLENALRPYLYNEFNKGPELNHKKVMALFDLYFLVGLVSLFSLVILVDNLQYITQKEKYLEIQPYFSFAVLSIVPLILIRIFNLQLMYKKRSGDLFSLTLIKAIIVVSLFLILTPKYNIWGAIMAICISNVLSSIIYAYKSMMTMKIKYNWTLAFGMCVMFSLAVGSQYLIDFQSLSLLLLVEFSVFIALSIYIYFIKIHKFIQTSSDTN